MAVAPSCSKLFFAWSQSAPPTHRKNKPHAHYRTYSFPELLCWTAGAELAVIVIHSMEASERLETAENVARWFAQKKARASAHVCIDTNSIVTCVAEHDTAWHALGLQRASYGIEHAGYARQTPREWLDPMVSGCCAVPRNRLRLSRTATTSGLSGSLPRISARENATALPGTPTSRTHPGNRIIGIPVPVSPGTHTLLSLPPTSISLPAWKNSDHPLWTGRFFRRGIRNDPDLAIWQQQMVTRGRHLNTDGNFGLQTAQVVRAFQHEKGLAVDGIIGPVTLGCRLETPCHIIGKETKMSNVPVGVTTILTWIVATGLVIRGIVRADLDLQRAISIAAGLLGLSGAGRYPQAIKATGN